MEIDMDMNDDVVISTPMMQTPVMPAVTQQLAPNHTVYIRNINYKLPVNEVRKALYKEFVKYGEILDIVVGEKRYALKGQAWVIFDRIESAQNAVVSMKDKAILNRPVTVTFAKKESDLILKREGRFEYKPRTFVSYAEKISKDEDSSRSIANRFSNAPPNNKLLIFDLPVDVANDELLPIIKPYSGFKELSIVPGRGIAFVDFDTIHNAGNCLNAIKNLSVRGERIHATYAK